MDCTTVNASSLSISDNKCYQFNTKTGPFVVSLSKGVFLISLKGAAGGVTTYAQNISAGKGGHAKESLV